jgi:hypothetical protein
MKDEIQLPSIKAGAGQWFYHNFTQLLEDGEYFLKGQLEIPAFNIKQEFGDSNGPLRFQVAKDLYGRLSRCNQRIQSLSYIYKNNPFAARIIPNAEIGDDLPF